MPDVRFLDLLAERVVLFDGGTGTEIYRRGVFLNRCYEELNLERPSIVEEVHRSFLTAGADVIETNSFAANRPKLEPHGLGERVRDVNRAAAEIGRRAVGPRGYVAGALGPLGIRLEPWGPTTLDEAIAIYREQIAGLLEGSVDLFVCETFGDLLMIQAAVTAVRQAAPDLPLIAMMTVDEEGRSPEGVPAEWLGQKLDALGADVIGVNCSVGPAPMLSVIETLHGVSDKPLAAMPNAGLPRMVEGRTLYLSSPTYMASYARRFVQSGAQVVGGCCGVTPEHIAALRAVVDGLRPGAVAARLTRPLPAVTPKPAVPRETRTRLSSKAYGGKFVSLIELAPPTGWEVSHLDDTVATFSALGIDAVLIPDESRGAARMNPLAMAQLARTAAANQNLPIDVLLQYVCRSRTLHEMQSDLLGARALGVQHLWVVTGTTPRPGEGVWSAPEVDVDAIGLTNVITRLNHGLDVGDNPIGASCGLVAAVQVLPAAEDLESEVRRFEWKVDAGAELAITAPLFEVGALQKFAERIYAARIPLIASVWPLSSLREAEFFAGEVPGVAIAPNIIDRMEAAEHAGRAAEEGLAIAAELIEALLPDVEGIALRGHLVNDPRALALLAPLATRVTTARAFPGRIGFKHP